MQRNQDDGVVICCDFCGTDWDQVKPMIEGHHGSVLCLECLKAALGQIKPQDWTFSCTLCLREGLPAGTARWTHPAAPPAANAAAVLCADCLHQAMRTFGKDPDVDFKQTG